MKKIIALMLAVIMTAGAVSVLAEGITFPDLPADHWAYEAVSRLVADGTVNGMSDGTYAPRKLVSRAEFAKMIGKLDAKRANDFADLPNSHWSYEYVMYSGIKGDADNNFRPDEPMLRGDVIDVLWERAGKPSAPNAPSVISSQGENPQAAAWAYTYGIMVGNDGLNLRLGDGVSRAEVAALIMRSRTYDETKKNNFVDTVNDDLLRAAFEGSQAFDVPYEGDKPVTNGQMARAALKIATEQTEPNYNKFSVAEPFAHEYVKDLYAVGTACIGEDKITAEFIDKNVNNLDAVSMLTFAFIKKSNESIVYDTSDKCYSDVGDIPKNTAYTCIAYANGNGVQLYSDGSIKPSSQATMRDIAAMLLQLDKLIGTMSCYVVEGEGYTSKDVSMSYDMGMYPEDVTPFPGIIEDMPAEVYTVPFMNMQTLDGSYGRNPKKIYDFTRDFRSLFLQLMVRDRAKIEETTGVKVKFTFYPALVCDNRHGFTVRLKTEIVSLGGKTGVKYGDIFRLDEGVNGNVELKEGMVIYNDSHMPYELGSYGDTYITFGNIVATK